MRRVVIDSGIGIPAEFIKRYQIEVVPVNIFLKDEDLSKESYDRIIEILKQGKNPRPSGISPKRLYETYKKLKGYEIISIHISKKLSGIYNTAKVVSKRMEREGISVKVLDSYTGGPAAGILIMKKINEILDEKINPEKIEKDFERLSRRVETLIIAEEPQRLMKIRPLEGLKKVLKDPGVLIKYIKSGGGIPVIKLEGEKLKVSEFVKEEKAMSFVIFDYLKRNVKDFNKKVLAIIFGLKDSEKLKKLIEENFTNSEVYNIKPPVAWVISLGLKFLGISFIIEND